MQEPYAGHVQSEAVESYSFVFQLPQTYSTSSAGVGHAIAISTTFSISTRWKVASGNLHKTVLRDELLIVWSTWNAPITRARRIEIPRRGQTTIEYANHGAKAVPETALILRTLDASILVHAVPTSYMDILVC